MTILCKPLVLAVQLVVVMLLLNIGSVFADHAHDLQKLFYTPQQRQKIDDVRYQYDSNKAKNSVNSSTVSQTNQKNTMNTVDTNETMLIEGYIKRNDGKNVIWYNNTNTLKDKQINQNIRIRPKSISRNGINIISSNKRIKLKPGQVLEITTGKVNEQYKLEDASATVKIEKQK